MSPGIDTDGPPAGPAWLGIGAQRSGTTWFTELLLQHPDVGLGREGRKEMHAFDSAAFAGWGAGEAQSYRESFRSAAGARLGEFTPAYLRMPWIAPLVRSTCGVDPLLLVLLRDPIDRFLSAMRWYVERRPPARVGEQRLDKFQSNMAVWAGMYGAQLGAWREVFPSDRFVVLQYESLRVDPAAAVTGVWRRLGLSEEPIEPVTAPSRTSTSVAYTPNLDLAQMRSQLRAVYDADVARVCEEWGLERSLWANFS